MVKRRLFYDIETSYCEGHFWRPGYGVNILPHQVFKHAQIICISWKWEGKDKIHNAHWGLKEQCDKKLLERFIKELDKADEIVAHNGDRFDIKWIRTRALYHDLPMRPKYNSIDTLKMAKRYLRLPSNKLAEVAKYYGLTNKLDAGGMQTWIDIVQFKKQSALKHMIYYCDGDITTLEEVYNKLKPYALNQFNYATITGGEKFRCPECTSHNVKISKSFTTAAGTKGHYMKCKESNCKTHYKINNKTLMALFEYRMINGIK